MESVYLYGKDQTDLYQNLLTKINEKNCKFEQVVITQITTHEKLDDNLESHVNNCPSCLKVYEKELVYKKKIREMIPNVHMSGKNLELMNTECFNIIEQRNILERKESIRKRAETKNFLIRIFNDLTRALASFTFLKGACYSVISVFVLYLFM